MSKEMSSFAKNIMENKYSHTKRNGELETWEEIAKRVTKKVLGVIPDLDNNKKKRLEYFIKERKFIPAGRYLYAAGRPFHQTQNCLLLKVQDSRESWADLLSRASLALMTGAGIGVDYSAIRASGKPIRKTGGISTGPISLMGMLNECGRGIIQGGSRRSALFAGLTWKHPDIFKFITSKNWSDDVRRLKEKDFNFPAFLDGTNISVQLDDDFFKAYDDDKDPKHNHARAVYDMTIKQMFKTGEPGFSINCGKDRKETLRNACAESTSEDDNDICNLGSINMANVESLEEMEEIVDLGTMFLLAGTLYSDVPYPEVDMVRTQNRRLGLGLMGLHEFLLKKGKKYAPDEELEEYLKIYETSGEYANKYADEWEINRPIKTRCVAPNRTTGIVSETTTGIEPIFCAAYKRRYLKGTIWHYEYVIDPVAKRLIESGINPDEIEDAYTLARDISKRIEFQAWIQKYVDQSISSTINIPHSDSSLNIKTTLTKYGKILMEHLPNLRGITVYPDGARGGQPITPVKYTTAIKHTGNVFVEQADICDITKGGSCG